MSGDDRDDIEEGEVRSLLGVREPRVRLPAYATVVERARRPRLALVPLAGAIAAVVFLAAAGIWFSSRLPSAVANPTPGPSQSAVCEPSASAVVGPLSLGTSLRTVLEAITPSDPQSNQLRWVLRFTVPSGAPGPATITSRAQITVSGRSGLQVLGYDLLEPAQRALGEGEVLTVGPCQTVRLVVRAGGPLLEGTFPYELTIDKVGLPEGGTVSARYSLQLSCNNRAFTCTPVAAGTTPAPTPTPVAGILSPHFGVIYQGVRQGYEKGSAPLVRREGETSTVAELAPSFFNQFAGAVSPDGRRAVYFAQPQNEPWALYLLDGARPTDLRKLTVIDGEIPGGSLVWAADGSGVAFAVLDQGANQGVTPRYSAIRTLDITSGKVTELARVTDGSAYALVGWDRAPATLAALMVPHGAPASTYVVFGSSGRRTWQLDGEYSVYGAPNGRDVVGIRCAAGTGCSLWTWTLADFDTRVDRKVGPGLSLGFVGFRPNSNDLGLFVSSSASPSAQTIELWSADAGQRVIYGPVEQMPDAMFFRADGSAVIVSTRPTETLVVDLRTKAVSSLPQPVPSAPFEIGRPVASIALD